MTGERRVHELFVGWCGDDIGQGSCKERGSVMERPLQVATTNIKKAVVDASAARCSPS